MWRDKIRLAITKDIVAQELWTITTGALMLFNDRELSLLLDAETVRPYFHTLIPIEFGSILLS